MDVAGSAAGIASLGIQVCQGLLSYYDDWKSVKSDIRRTYDSIDNLGRTLISLKASLNSEDFDKERRDRSTRCILSCEESLVKLSEKSQKLRNYGQPEGLRQKAWTELQRAWYPFRASTLAKLREIVADVREQLKLAVQVLQLDVSTASQQILESVATDTSNLVNRTVAIETSVTHLSAQTQQVLALQQSDQFKKIKAWVSPPNPWTNHNAARQRHEPDTGTWLLQADQYQKWKAGDIHHLWLYGKAGCGKTVLCSTVVEDVREYCDSSRNAMYAAFYFTFSDNQKQSYEDLLRSLVAQLGWKEPGLSMLTQACEKRNANTPAVDELEKIMLACIQPYDKLFLLLDALDECPEDSEVRQNVLGGLEREAHKAGNVRMFVTSREVTDVGDSMQTLGASFTSVAAPSVDADIRRYTSRQLLLDRKLCKLNETTKNLIRDKISQRANGMFRWAYCQLQELKKLKSTRPSVVGQVLLALPSTLDETYERILVRIDHILRKQAIGLLQWLAYARYPPTRGELAEASIVDPRGEGSVQVDDRGGLQDTLEILAELVTCDKADNNGDNEVGDNEVGDNEDDWVDISSGEDSEEGEDENPESDNVYVTWSGRKIGRSSRVRFAHFSVKEYLESKRIIQSSAKDFFLEAGIGHGYLAQSCLMYILHYSSSCEKTSSTQDLLEFPLLRYAAESWFYHSLNGLSGDVSREVHLLQSEDAKRDWLRVYRPDVHRPPFTDVHYFGDVGSGLYYASHVGLVTAVSMLLDEGVDVSARGGECGNALQAASYSGHEKVVSMLIERGADVNARGGGYGNALQAASFIGHEKVVSMLIERGADVNAQGGCYGNALQAASFGSRENVEKVVPILIERGADVNAQGGYLGNALQAAASMGHEKVVSMLIERGADVNAQGGVSGNALQAASIDGYEKVVSILIEQGADVNAQGGLYSNALEAALQLGHEKVEGGAGEGIELGDILFTRHSQTVDFVDDD